MEGLAQGGTEVPFGVCGQAGEPESGRVSVPGDARQHEQAMAPLVIDTAARIGVRDLGGHLRQPGQQKRRDLLELLIEDGRPPETDQILRAPGIRPPPREAIPAAPPTALHQGDTTPSQTNPARCGLPLPMNQRLRTLVHLPVPRRGQFGRPCAPPHFPARRFACLVQ